MRVTPKPRISFSVWSRVLPSSSSLGASKVVTWRGLAWPAAGTRTSAATASASGRAALRRERSIAYTNARAASGLRSASIVRALMTAIVDTPEEAAALDLPPLLVRRPLEAFLDAHGLGSGPVEATTIGEGHSNVTFEIARGGERWVLRRPPRPPLPPSAHAALREARPLTPPAPAGSGRAARGAAPPRGARRPRAHAGRRRPERRRVDHRRAVLRDG